MLPPLPIRAGLWLVLLAAHALAAGWLLPRLPIHADLEVEANQDTQVTQALTDEKQFPSLHPMVLIVPEEEVDLWEDRLTDSGLPVRSLRSLGLEGPRAHLLFRTTRPGRSLLFVPTVGQGQSEAEKIANLVAEDPKVVVGGEAWSRRLMDQALARDVAWLFPASLAVIGLMFFWLVRRPGQALWLTVASTMPAIDVLLCFPLFGLPMDFTTVLAPLLVLALTKKYNLWVHRHMEASGPGHRELFSSLGRAVAWSAGLSSLGFATLLVSPLSSLRNLAVLLWIGLASALVWCLVIVPDLTRRWPRLALGGTSRRGWRAPSFGPGWIVPVVCLGLAAGIVFVHPARHWTDYLGSGSPQARQLAAFEDEMPAWQEVVLRIEGPEDEAWLEPGRWETLVALVDTWRRQAPDTGFFSVADMIPEGGTDLGQRLELLPPASSTGKLIDGARRTLVVRLALPASADRRATLGQRLAPYTESAQGAFPGFTCRWSGFLVRQDRAMEDFLEGEAWGAAGYFLVTGLLAMIVLRSVRRGVLSMTPALAAAAVLVGLSGWLGWAFTPATALVAAACLGQCTDDGLLWGLLGAPVRIRGFFWEATALLAVALSVLGFSSFANIQQAAVLVILALFTSTALVLGTLPWEKQQ